MNCDFGSTSYSVSLLNVSIKITAPRRITNEKPSSVVLLS